MFLEILNKNPLLGIFSSIWAWLFSMQGGLKNIFELIAVILAVLLTVLSIYAKILQIKRERKYYKNKK